MRTRQPLTALLPGRAPGLPHDDDGPLRRDLDQLEALAAQVSTLRETVRRADEAYRRAQAERRRQLAALERQYCQAHLAWCEDIKERARRPLAGRERRTGEAHEHA